MKCTYIFTENLIGKQRRLDVAMQRYEISMKRHQVQQQILMQQKIEELEAEKLKKAIELEAQAQAEAQALAQIQAQQNIPSIRLSESPEKSPTPEPTEKPKERRPSRFAVTTIAQNPQNVPEIPPSISETTEKAEGTASGIWFGSNPEQAAESAKSDTGDTKQNTEPNTERRPSFLDSVGLDPNSPAMKALIQLSTKPKKSILKKSHSYTIHSFGLPGMSRSAQNSTGM